MASPRNIYMGPRSCYARHEGIYVEGSGVGVDEAAGIAMLILRDLRRGWGYDKGCRRITIDPVRAIQRLRYLIPLATKHRGSAEAERVKQLVEHVTETGTIPSWARPRIAYTYPVPQPVQKKRRAVAVA
jgi:hypothetical protein